MAGKTLQTFVLATCLLLSVSLSEVGGQLLPVSAPAHPQHTNVVTEDMAVALRGVSAAIQEAVPRTQRACNDTSPLQCECDFILMFQDKDAQNISKGERALDAFGKPGPYILEGNVRLTGSFDECLNIRGDMTQFCILPLVPFKLESGQVDSTKITFLADVCVPKSCSIADFEFFVPEINKHLEQHNISYRINYTSEGTICEDTKSFPYSGGAIAMIVVCSIFALLALIGTAVDFGVKTLRDLSKKPELARIFKQPPPAYNSDGEDSPLLAEAPKKEGKDMFTPFEKPLEFITAFSIIKNINIVFSTKIPPTAITSLNGIRVLSMGWVILSHTFFWFLETGTQKAPLYSFKLVTHRFTFQAISNGFFAVDSFFFLSGALVSYLTLREMERKKGKFPILTFYLHRYLRLTMVYAFLLFFWWTLTVHLGNGPVWRTITGVDSEYQTNCEKYWWTNILYINNLYPWALKDECMPWTWYLSNDMQFYVLAPLIVIPLYFIFPIGLLISAILIIMTIAVNGAIAGVKGFEANVIQDSVSESNDTYIKPYTRAGPYIVGLVLGFVLFKKVRINIHWFVDWLLYRVILIVAGGCLFSTVYGLYSSWGRGGLTLAENVSYFMFGRVVWAVGLSLLVFACHNGYGRAINAFLSMRVWVPLSRMTYTAYLIHPIILTVIFNTLREPFTYADYTLTIYAVATVVLSFGAAGVVAVFVEFPLSNLEMAVFKVAGLRPRESTRNPDAQKKDVRLEARKTDSPIPINEGLKA